MAVYVIAVCLCGMDDGSVCNSSVSVWDDDGSVCNSSVSVWDG